MSKELLIGLDGVEDVTYEWATFLGEDNSFLPFDTLSTTLGVTEGTAINRTGTNIWLKFILDGKNVFVPKINVRATVTWSHLYSKGLVYGIDDVGLSPVGEPTNQLRTVEINGKSYLVRLIQGCDPGNNPLNFPSIYNDPSAALGDYGGNREGVLNSEWNRLFYPIIIDAKITTYPLPKQANYTPLQLEMINSGGTAVFCQETLGNMADNTYHVFRGNGSVDVVRGFNSANTHYGWRPILVEL